MKRTGILRDGSAKFHAPLSRMKEEGRPPQIWRRMFFHQVPPNIVDTFLHLGSRAARYPGGHWIVRDALGCVHDTETLMALHYFGVTAAKIVRNKLTWNFPTAEDAGEDAIIVPVGGVAAPLGACLPLLGAHARRREKAPEDIGDLIAIALSDGSPLSFNATTAAIGAFEAVDGRVRIATNGLNWLKRHVVRARKSAEEMPAHLVARTLDLPDGFETLLLERDVFSFRLEDTTFPAGTKEIVCPDSAELAEFIVSQLRLRDRLPPAPQVLGPKA